MPFLLSFGLASDGQCGSGDEKEEQTVTLVHFPPKVSVIQVSAGSRHSLALSSSGHVYRYVFIFLFCVDSYNINIF